ncbi:MAG: MFS transporter [Butyricicoccus sp.]|nr:MFS transporter [Butyricicoccus sp.]
MKDLNRQFFALQGLIITIQAITASFLSTILVRQGFPSADIGLTFTLAALGAMILRPLLGTLCDRVVCVRPLTLLGAFISSLCYTGLIFGPPIHTLQLILAVLTHVIICSTTSVVDSWSTRLIFDGYNINFGLTRSAGSLFYAIACALFGMVMAQFGPKPGTFVLIVLFLALVFLVCRLPDPTLSPRTKNTITFRHGLSVLCQNRIYCLTLFGIFLAHISSAQGDSFLSVRMITELGGTEADMGLAFFLQAISEVPILILYQTTRRRFRIPLRYLMALSAFVFAFKPLLFGLAGSPTALILMSMLNGLGFGIYVTAVVDFILETVDQEYLSTGQLLFSAVGAGLGAMVGNAFGGITADHIGAGNTMICFSIFGMIGSLIILFGARRKEEKL